MHAIPEYFKVNIRKAPLGMVLLTLLVLEVFTGGYMSLQKAAVTSDERVLTLSEIDGPTIDAGAAATSMAQELCSNFPQPVMVWFLVLVALSILLIGNFLWALLTKVTVEWVPEAAYVVLGLCLWAFLDRCHVAIWFPLILMKAGLLIFALYLYLFEKKNTL